MLPSTPNMLPGTSQLPTCCRLVDHSRLVVLEAKQGLTSPDHSKLQDLDLDGLGAQGSPWEPSLLGRGVLWVDLAPFEMMEMMSLCGVVRGMKNM